jgi:hypothetical protein
LLVLGVFFLLLFTTSLVLSGVVFPLEGGFFFLEAFPLSGEVPLQGAVFVERDSSLSLGCDSGTVVFFFKAAATCDSPLPGDIMCSNTLPVQSTGAFVSQFKIGRNVFL